MSVNGSEQITTAKEWKEKLFLAPKNLGNLLSEEEIATAFSFCEGYKEFLTHAKTEREAVTIAVARAEEAGFTPFDPGKTYHPGDRVYYNNRGKAVILATVGKRSLAEGVHILAAHIDSPRLDLKQSPLYEDGNLALCKTHYYGGVKKYQWTALPLSLHGVIIRADGTKVTVVIGEDPSDPVFCVSDLLPHLATDQMKRTLNDGVKGEELNLLVGSLPFRDDEVSEALKLNILHILWEKYGIVERDFLCAELELVPAFDAKDVGFDHSMVGSYGQDDRVCAYTCLEAALACTTPDTTLITVLADKEETGSDGNTGLKSAYLKYFIQDLAAPHGIAGRTVLAHSACLSADVTAAFDPTFPDVLERKNASFLNHGVSLMKYSGSRGKSATSDASSEFTAEITRMLDQAGVIWQMGALGKVDQGGGGTVAAYVANLGVDVIDIGVPIISMHSPFEVAAKLDIYMAYRAFVAFAAS